MFSFRYTSSVSKHKQTILSHRMGLKLSSILFFISSPNTDGFYRFYISQGSVKTQLRCGGMFSNHFITNFPQNALVKNFWESVNTWQRYGQKFVTYQVLVKGHPVHTLFLCKKGPDQCHRRQLGWGWWFAGTDRDGDDSFRGRLGIGWMSVGMVGIETNFVGTDGDWDKSLCSSLLRIPYRCTHDTSLYPILVSLSWLEFKQESLDNAKVSAWQQCMYEGP